MLLVAPRQLCPTIVRIVMCIDSSCTFIRSPEVVLDSDIEMFMNYEQHFNISLCECPQPEHLD